MTATTGFTGIGALLKLGDGASPETFSSIGNVVDFTMNLTSGDVDATHLGSTSGFREFKQGFKEATVDFNVHFDPDNTTHDDSSGLWAKYISGATVNFKADFSAADNGGAGAPATDAVCTFAGVITQLTLNVSEGMVGGAGSIRMSSNPTWGAS